MPETSTKGKKTKKGEKAQSHAVPEFIVLKIAPVMEPGSTVSFVGSSSSMKGAIELANRLVDNTASRLAILEKRAVFSRRPAMMMEVIEERIAKPRQ